MSIQDLVVAVRHTADGSEVTLKEFYNQHGPINGLARFVHRLPNGERIVVDARVRPMFKFDYSDVGKDGDLVVVLDGPAYLLQLQQATVLEKNGFMSVLRGRPVIEHRLDMGAELVSFNGHKVVSKY